MEIMQSETGSYVVIPYSDFNKLKQFAKIGVKKHSQLISVDDMYFLSKLLQRLEPFGSGHFEFVNDTVILKIQYYDGRSINSSFDISLCKKYYSNIDNFIKEII